jgi:hypothetical protein
VRKRDSSLPIEAPSIQADLGEITDQTLKELDFTLHPSPSHVYLAVLKRAFERGVDVEKLHLADIVERLSGRGIVVNSKSGLFEAV